MEMTLRSRSEELEEGSGTSRFPEGAGERRKKKEEEVSSGRRGTRERGWETHFEQQPERRGEEGVSEMIAKGSSTRYSPVEPSRFWERKAEERQQEVDVIKRSRRDSPDLRRQVDSLLGR